MKKSTTLNWGDRFAIIDHFTPTDVQITSAFNLTQGELDTARSLRLSGTFSPNTRIKPEKYGHMFGITVDAASTVTVHTTGTITVSTKATVHTRPESATKKVKVPQKRGRKGNRIELAFQSVTETPVRVDDFMKQHNVSLAVLRQSKRFIEALGPTLAERIGTIEVRQDKTTKQLMVWKHSTVA